MNRQTYRLVFNRTRGALMAVQETAGGVGGACSGQTRDTRSRRPRATTSFGTSLRTLCRAVLVTSSLSAWAPAVWSQTLPITASPNAPAGQRPIIDAAANGVPIVHIAPPAAAGVSRNGYQDFNVNAKGLILDNSSANVQSQLGGWVVGNPQLGYVPARLIVNEVLGTSQSVLKGTIEVAGRRADVVIANPNGLIVDGLGFINTDRATLTTGTPRYTAQGGLQGFSVTRGQLGVGAGGLDATSLEQLDLIARGLVIEGEVWARNLHVLAGASRVLYASLGEIPAASAQAGAGSAPLFAIDIKQLGGMYAGQIYLVGTEQGLGVNSTGRIAALQGNLQLSATGDLTLEDTYASRGMALASAGNMSLTGQTQTPVPTDASTPGDVSLAAAGTLSNAGTLDSAARVTANAGVIANSGTLIQRGTAAPMSLHAAGAASNSGTVYSAGDLAISATSYSDSNGTLQAAGALSAAAQDLSLRGTRIASGTSLALNATSGDLSASGTTMSAGTNASLSASGQLAHASGLLQAQTDIALHAASIANRDSTVLATGVLNANTPGQLDNTGGKLLGGAAVNVIAGHLVNDASATNSSLVASDHATTITARGIDNRAGVLSAKTVLSVDAQGAALDNASGIVVSDDALAVTAGRLDNVNGRIVARSRNGGALAIAAADVGNAHGVIDAAARLELTASGALDNTQGRLTSLQSTRITTTGALTNNGGEVSAAKTSDPLSTGDLTIAGSGHDLSNNGGRIVAEGQLKLDAGAVGNAQGTIAAGADATLSVASLANTAGTVQAGRNLAIAATREVTSDAGQLLAAQDLAISAASIAQGNGALAVAGRDETLGVNGALVNAGGSSIAAQRNATLSATMVTNVGGRITANGTLALAAGSGALNNANGTIAASGAVSTRSGALTNTAGTLASIAGTLDVDTHGQSLTNDAGRIQAAGDLTLRAGATSTRGGTISGANLNLATGALDTSAGGTIAATANLQAITQAVNNDRGTLQSGADMTLDTQGQALVNTHAGSVLAGGALALDAGGAIDNAGGTLASNGALQLVTSSTLDNSAGGTIQSASNLSLSSTSLNNAAGRIATTAGSGAGIVISTGALTNTGGQIASDRDLSLNATSLTADGSINAQRDAAVRLQSDFAQNDASTLTANRVLNLSTSGNFANTGNWSLPGTLDLTAANITNAAGARIAASATRLQTTGGAAGGGSLANAGRIEGESIGLAAGTLTNTGAVIGGLVTTSAGSLTNDGAAAVIASTQGSTLWVKNTLANRNGATLYSLGDIDAAASSALDATGMSSDLSASIVNDSSLIEARGNLGLAVQALTNTRVAPVIATVTDPVTTQTQTKRTKYDNCPKEFLWGRGYNGFACGGGYGDYRVQWTRTIDTSGVISDTPDAQGTRKLVFLDNGVQATLYYSSQTTSGTSKTVSYWDGYDPDVNFDPATEYGYLHGWGHHTIHETSRDVTTTTQRDVDASPAGTVTPQILSGAAMNLNIADSLTNNYGVISAGATLTIAGASRTSVASGNYGSLAVTNTGAALSKYVRQDIVSTYAWNEDPTQDMHLITEAPAIKAPEAIGQVGGIIGANAALRVYAGSLGNSTVGSSANPYGNGVATAASVGTQGAGPTAGVIAIAAVPVAARGAGSVAGPSAAQERGSGERARDVILTMPPRPTVPQSGLFSIHSQPGAKYLVEADPRFTSYRNFIGSDYFEQQLAMDPERSLERYGDGFTEQNLVNDQILALTGRHYLTGYSDTEDEYKALMNAGVAFARQYRLSPGVALSPEQMALLTTDIAWLVPRSVTLADGSTQQVLVPQVYIRRPRDGDLRDNGALMAGSDVVIRTSGDIASNGRIGSDHAAMVVGGHDVDLSAGSVRGQDIFVRAGSDLKNVGGSLVGVGQDTTATLLAGRDIIVKSTTSDASAGGVNSHATTTQLARLASVNVGTLDVQAGRDLAIVGAQVNASGDAYLGAKNAVTMDAVQTGSAVDASWGRGAYVSNSAIHDVGTQVDSGGSLIVAGGGNVTLKGTDLTAGGSALVQGANVSVVALKDIVSLDSKGQGKSWGRTASSDETLSGGTIKAGNALSIVATGVLDAPGKTRAGTGNATLTGAQVSATAGQAQLIANNDVTIQAATTEHSRTEQTVRSHSGLLSSSKSSESSSSQTTQVEGSGVSGSTVLVQAGRDATIAGSNVVGDGAVQISAGRDLTIATAEQTLTTGSTSEKTKSGLFGSDGSLTLGRQSNKQSATSTSTSQVGSSVASLNGNVKLDAGAPYLQTGSEVLAPKGDIDIAAKKVTIDAATNTNASEQEQHFRQDGLTLSVSNPVLAAARRAQQSAEAGGQTVDPRLKALAAVRAGLAASNAVDAYSADRGAAGGLSASLTAGSSRSDSQQSSQSSTAVGSAVAAGGDVRIRATGDGTGSTLTVLGSDIRAGHDASLKSDGSMTLAAAQNTSEQHTSSKSASADVGLGASGGSLGTAIGITANASASRGNGDGRDTSWSNTHISAGNKASLDSGGDVTLAGAVAQARQVTGDIAGNLNIQSLQDTSSFKSSDQSIGGSVTMGAGFAASVNLSQGKKDSTYAAVAEQGDLQAGDGGYQLNVKGNTDLEGGVIASSQAAIDNKANSLSTATLTQSDVQNHAQYSASQIGIGAGFTRGDANGNVLKPLGGKGSPGGVGTDAQGRASSAGMPGSTLPDNNGWSATSPIPLYASGKASSTTRSAISAGALVITDEAAQQALSGKTAEQTVASVNHDTGSSAGALRPIFDQKQVDAGFAIVGGLSREMGTFLDNRAKEADAKTRDRDEALRRGDLDAARTADAQLADLQKWAPGGSYRQATTALLAAFSGNVTGASSQIVQGATVNCLQGLGAQRLKDLAPALGGEGSPAHTALHGLLACAGEAAQGQDCGAAALGASAGVVINALMGDAEQLTAQQRQAREDIVTTLVAGVAAASGTGNVSSVVSAARIETENNALSLRGSSKLMTDLRRCSGGTGTSCDMTQLTASMQADTARQNARVEQACQGANASLAQCMALANNAGQVGINLLNSALMYADTPQKKALVGELISQQIADMEAMGAALEKLHASAGFGEILQAGIVNTLQAATMAGIPVKGPGKGAGKGPAGAAPVMSQGTANASSGAKLQQELGARANVRPDTSRDGYYAANTDRSVLTSNNFDMDHVLSGEINASGKATGYHAELAAEGAARITPGATVTQNANGTYQAPVQIWSEATKQWVDKARESTFFDPSWSEARITYEVTEAFKKGTPGTSFIETAPSGLSIQFHWDPKNKRTTFFPLGTP